MADGTIEWVPMSAADLTDRPQRVRTTTDPTVENETVVCGVAMVAVPALILVGAPTPLAVRTIAAVGLGLVLLAAFLFTRRGLYLATDGATVRRILRPRRIPWTDVAEFRLTPTGKVVGTGHEQVTVVHHDGTRTGCWFLKRGVDATSRRFPEGPARAIAASLPDLVDQLNVLRAEIG